jgi:hypothetical protein
MMTNWISNLAQHRGPRYLEIVAARADDIANELLPAGVWVPTHRELAY